MVKKAADILALQDPTTDEIVEILNGQKIVNFFHNIRYPKTSRNVTIDRHALSIAVGKKLTDEKMKLTKAQFEFFEHCYRWTADNLGISPLLLQSATWVKWRQM